MPKYTKRPDGRYRAKFNLGRDAQGKYRYKYIYGTTIKELERNIDAYKESVYHGIAPNGRKYTFEELAAIWLKDFTPNAAEQTRAQYAGLFRNHINPMFGHLRVSDLRKGDLQKLLNDLFISGASKSQLEKVKRISAAVLELAADNGLIARNPFHGIKIPAAEEKQREAITEAQRALIVATWQGHRMGIPALLMLFCGLRRGELIALTWSDIDLDTNMLTVNKAVSFPDTQTPAIKAPKTAKGTRMVNIPPMVADALRQANKASEYVCPSAAGKLMTRTAFRRAWESYMHYLNLQAGGADATRTTPAIRAFKEITPHQLRHTYATLLYSAGVDVLTAQRLLGHADPQITIGIYTHLDEQKNRTSIDALNAYIGQHFSK